MPEIEPFPIEVSDEELINFGSFVDFLYEVEQEQEITPQLEKTTQYDNHATN